MPREIVLVVHDHLDEQLEALKADCGLREDVDLVAAALDLLIVAVQHSKAQRDIIAYSPHSGDHYPIHISALRRAREIGRGR